MTKRKPKKFVLPDENAITAAISEAYERIPNKTEPRQHFEPDWYYRMAMELFDIRLTTFTPNEQIRKKTTTSKRQLQIELINVAKISSKLSSLLRRMSDRCRTLIENQDSFMAKLNGKKKEFYMGIIQMELNDLHYAAIRAIKDETEIEVQSEAGISNAVSDRAARDYWLATGRMPSRAFERDEVDSNKSKMRSDFCDFLEAIFKAISISRSVDNAAKKAVARFKQANAIPPFYGETGAKT
ncbi:hypothetical protein Rvan_2486 [Rhodomicrobium vannielii ATCC 17100]|uniref:Uncharacterized protein n=1 Tax=Rhodomicrobium vannielii (strain ATCC 17100 / DSM 162 / LMG 4299 / NCIMB 10020 / ATH 3.1.1) TaxID=648757 RepID=E3I5I0_RHOVT|nr:hypothetical protein [Rhodomicrobium vannielii]ADP71701.1 hypothetical protein Rvan_2486 [Rhodomicrobium vannielii ATCC 17100]